MAALPPHLRLGITLPGMRELFGKLPRDAVDQVNAGIPSLDASSSLPAVLTSRTSPSHSFSSTS